MTKPSEYLRDGILDDKLTEEVKKYVASEEFKKNWRETNSEIKGDCENIENLYISPENAKTLDEVNFVKITTSVTGKETKTFIRYHR